MSNVFVPDKISQMGEIDPTDYISQYFKWNEFLRTETGVDNTPTAEAAQNLEKLAAVLDIFRDKFGPINITSGYRSANVQQALRDSGNAQAAAYSLHQEGLAADITPTGVTAQKLFAEVAGTPELAAMVGEFALKANTIHMSLPTSTKQQVFMYVNAADQYIRYTAQELSDFIAKNKTAVIASGIALGAIVFSGLGLFTLIILRKRGIL